MTQPIPVQLLGQFPVTAPDLAWGVDVDPLMTETTSEIQNLCQDLGNRLIETPGSNLDFGNPNTRGVGIFQYLSGTLAQLQGLPARIDAEFVQDPRVTDSYTQPITQNPDGTYSISVQVTALGAVWGLSYAWSQTGLVALPVTT